MPSPRRRGGHGLRSRVVAWLRVLLPLAALGLLATLFMWSGRPDPESVIPYTEGGADLLAGPPRMTAPAWAGVTDDGARVALSAASATPRSDAGAHAEAMRLDWAGPEGTEARATAPQAAMEGGWIHLDGGVAVDLSSGWHLEAARLSASRERAEVRAEGGLSITAPFGTLTADAARLHRPGDGAAGGEVLDFTGRVRLLYQP